MPEEYRTSRDKSFMKRAIRIAAKAAGMTSPNPMVGAVIVKGGKIIAEDYHKMPGELHAEALAILRAKGKAENSTLYVTLEPCCHLDKRTPPCTKAIIDAGVRKVVIAMKDPNPKVSGKGIEVLRKHGITVIDGVLGNEAEELNEAYCKYMRTGMPFVTLKVAMTLDGKIATPEGQSKWITGEAARKIVHRMRSEVDAVLTAAGTVKADNPELTVRLVKRAGGKGRKAKNPKRVIIDPDLEIPLDYKVFAVPPETIVITRKSRKPVGADLSEDPQRKVRGQKVKALAEKGIKILEYEGGRLDLPWLMRKLGEIEVTSVMLEGGASLNAYALQDGIVDKVVFFIAPMIIGGKDSIPAIGGSTFQKLEEAYRVRDLKVKRAGMDLMISGYIIK